MQANQGSASALSGNEQHSALRAAGLCPGAGRAATLVQQLMAQHVPSSLPAADRANLQLWAVRGAAVRGHVQLVQQVARPQPDGPVRWEVVLAALCAAAAAGAVGAVEALYAELSEAMRSPSGRHLQLLRCAARLCTRQLRCCSSCGPRSRLGAASQRLQFCWRWHAQQAM